MVDTETPAYFEGRIEEVVNDFILKQTDKIIKTNCFIIPFEEDMVYKYFIDNPELFTRILYQKTSKAIQSYNLPINIKNLRIAYDTNFLALSRLRSLGAEMLYKAQTFDAVIVGEGEIKAYTKSGKAYCKNCIKSFDVDLSTEKIELPNCSSCKKLTEIDKKTIQYGEMKEVIIREPFEMSVDRQPIEYSSCYVKDNWIHQIYTGKKVRIVGMRGVIMNKKENRHRLYIEILSADELADSKDILPDNAEILSFKEEAAQPDFLERLITSFAPDLYCAKESVLWNVKYSTLLFLATGNAIENKRQFVNLFLCGDPGVGKSTIMKYVVSISPHSMYISGNGASEAGLTAIIEKQPDGKYIAKAGILPMCDGGFAAVDEMNLMSKENQNSLQESMENQFVTKAKAANIQLPSRCGVLGGANPMFGKWDFDRTVIENLEMSVPLLNRFDLKWNIIDQINEIEDAQIITHAFKYMTDSKSMLEQLPFPRLRMIKYLNFVRQHQPILLPEVEKKIANFVNKIRAITKDKRSMPMDKRIIESLTRLSIAHAKLLLKETVQESDVDVITNLYLKSLETFGIDTKSEITQTKFYDSKELNQTQTFWKCFDESMDAEGSVDMVVVIDKLACTKFFDEYRAKSFFEKMIASRKLYEVTSGRWKKVD